jgi:hypothetical protein
MALTQVQQGMVGTQTSIPTQYGSLGAGNATTIKNRIINGAMVVNQRGVSSGTAVGYTVDRWTFNSSLATKGTWAVNAGSVTPPAGFVNYLGFTSNSAYTVGASDYFTFAQYIEGFNTADLGWGTANAKTVTLSAWVRSSLTGTFAGSIQNSAQTRSYPFTYSIPVANTWTQISVTIAGDTSGTWLTDNSVGIRVWFSLGIGSTYTSGTANAWQSGTYTSVTGATSVVGTSGATFYFTGVQLEVGSSATGFEYRQYGQELSLCQRYYSASPGTRYVIFPAPDATFAYADIVTFPVVMRTTPTWSASVSYQNYVSSYSILGTSAFNNSYLITASLNTNINVYYTWTASAEL